MSTWWTLDLPADRSLDRPGIYEWRIGTETVYVGKSLRLASRLREYPNNVQKLKDGRPYRLGNPHGYRKVHRELLRALEKGLDVQVTILENCERQDLSGRERHWITKRIRQGDEGGPKVLNAEAKGNEVAQMIYCWRSGVDLPMLNETEWERLAPLLAEAVDPAKRRAALDLYEEMTGFRETNINAIWNCRIAKYGPPCVNCRKPLRTPRAKFCAACGLTASPT